MNIVQIYHSIIKTMLDEKSNKKCIKVLMRATNTHTADTQHTKSNSTYCQCEQKTRSWIIDTEQHQQQQQQLHTKHPLLRGV